MILRDHDPTAFCCQETYTRQDKTTEFRKYSSYHGRASGGVSVMVKKQIPHVNLSTNLLSLHRTQTLCSIYIRLNYALVANELEYQNQEYEL